MAAALSPNSAEKLLLFYYMEKYESDVRMKHTDESTKCVLRMYSGCQTDSAAVETG